MKAVALAVALAALGIAVFALVRTFVGAPEYTDAQRADAAAGICAAFDTVRTGVATNTNLTPPDDVSGALATAANARVALFDGGQYLLARLDPATPPELGDAVRRFADTLLDIGANATAGLPNSDPGQAARLDEAETAADTVARLCASRG
ncbi:hypothetical protein [Mycolicibacterium sp.]|uniref:hypothetical protein n=1 Tax=Mycolicibacterium sp. TaxID=2320850 RepID=UPI003D103281